MIGRDGTYFHPMLCLDPHFIVTGHTNDWFCTDALQLVDVQQALHGHLRRQGFDAVIFLDINRSLYCYDEQSFAVLTTGRLPEQPAAAAPAAAAGSFLDFSMLQAGPFGAAEPEPEPAPAPQPQPARAANGPGKYSLNMSRMRLNDAWGNVMSLLERTELRCALVLNNIAALQSTLTENQVNTLTQLSSYHSTNHSIVIYLFRGSELARLADAAATTSNPAWMTLYRSILQPRIEGNEAETNRVISLRVPNAAEVRNLLNSIRLRPDRPGSPRYPVEVLDLEQLALTYSAACCRKDWPLSRLILAIEDFYRKNPDSRPPLSMANWREVLDEPSYRPPMERLDALVGLQGLKRSLHEWYDRMSLREHAGPAIPARSSRFTAPEVTRGEAGFVMNVQLRGGPGTGKTTVARLLGELYHDLGLLPQGQLHEVNAADLVSENVGGTAAVMHEHIMQAMGGVLFIDEAYSLASNNHGQEALDQLVADLSRYEGQFAVVLAGYPRQIERLMEVNTGLPRRFPTVYSLPDYTGPEMRQLLELAARRAHETVTFGPELAERLDDFCENWVNGRTLSTWGNGGEAENLIEDMIKRCSSRMVREKSPSGTLVLLPQDLPEHLQEYLAPASSRLEDAVEIINQMIGLDNIKAYLKNLCNGIRTGEKPPVPGNYIFYGPPGTGKTTVARRMAELLYYLNVLPSKRFVELPAQKLLANRRKQNGDPMTISEILDQELENAWGGVLFIDEAHQLATTDQGREVILALVPKIENPDIRANVCVICAGYAKEMRDFLAVDKGLERRFPQSNRIRFDNYTAKQLRQILKGMAEMQGEQPEEGYLDRSEIALGRFLENPQPNFGNAGYIRDTYLKGSRDARQRRLVLGVAGSEDAFLTEAQAASIGEKDRRTLTAQDIPREMIPLAGPAGQPLPPERDAWTLIDELAGKQDVKDFVHTLRNEKQGSRRFSDAGGSAMLHLSIAGPNGSGRHTVARAMAGVWKALGRLETGAVTIASRANMVAGWVGQTPQMTQNVIDEALGGTLIVEYPSSMLGADGQGRDFGPEALGVLAGAMSRTDLSIILLDTEEGMQQLFRANSMFQSCLAHQFVLEDPTPEEMERIFRMQTAESLAFDPETERLLPDFFINWVSDRGGTEDSVRGWGNGMELPRLINELKTNWELQKGNEAVEAITRGGKTYELVRREITGEMFPQRVRRYLQSTRAAAETALNELDGLIGLARVKTAVHRIERKIRFTSREKVTPGLYCFLGNSGTGKTTVARLMGGVLRSVGVLKKGQVIERTAQQMAASADSFEKTLKLARDGVLFIDEAHQLADSAAGQQVIRRLLTVLEDPAVKKNTCIILAGYPAEMLRLLQLDSGLNRRFGTADSMIWFDDYSPEELLQILDYMAQRADRIGEIGADAPLTLQQGYREASMQVFRRVRAGRKSDFGNAGFVRNYLHDSISALQERLDTREGGYTPEEVSVLTAADVPENYRTLTRRRKANLKAAEINAAPFGPVNDENFARFKEYSRRCTVYLEITKNSSEGEGSGSIITADGYVLTCSHVVENAESIRARVYTPGGIGGDYRWFDCEIVDPRFEDCDMALLKLKGRNFAQAGLRPAESPVEEGERTLLAGFPLGKMLTNENQEALAANIFDGRISSILPVDTGRSRVDRCYMDGTGLHGNSGSPVFSAADGRLIGVFSGSINPKKSIDELNFFYPVSYFWRRFIDAE